MWGMIATWRMAVEGITKGAEMLKDGGDAGDAIESAIRFHGLQHSSVHGNSQCLRGELPWRRRPYQGGICGDRFPGRRL